MDRDVCVYVCVYVCVPLYCSLWCLHLTLEASRVTACCILVWHGTSRPMLDTIKARPANTHSSTEHSPPVDSFPSGAVHKATFRHKPPDH
jgi:hypothetical protein